MPGRLVATYSIVARDPGTGELGVAVQSHYFTTGAVVPWGQPGVGAVATQAFADPSYGPRALDLLREGVGAAEALERLVSADPQSAVRQVAIVDASGAVAVHTGTRCIAAAGHRIGDGFSAQGNMLRDDGVYEAMPTAFEKSGGDLASRLVAALDAAEEAGGDVRGRQSAALLVVSGDRSRPGWERQVDLRVDDHPAPLVELRRLLAIHRAYRLLARAEGEATAGRLDAARDLFEEAQSLHPGNPEFSFWAAVVLARSGRVEEARELLRTPYAADPGWRELVRRLPAAMLLPDDPDLVERLTDLP